ncbi:MAG: lactonase family protein, partial [Bacteroidia bacterium]|nr:lactonase family protein [Bacteroidia bacterium]
MTKLLITTTILLLATSSYGQKEGNIWYFGQNAGIDFNDTSAKAITNGAMYTSEGCATICNDSGELLMYTDGRQVWNKNHQGMSNGGGLRGHISSSQSSIILEKPGSDSLYYIFTVGFQGNTEGLRYSVVDLSQDNGKGAVTSQKNVLVVQPTCEKVTSIRHSNGRDYWIITHLYNSNSFNSYLLTSSGLDTNAVVSSLGMTITGFSKRTIGYLRPSRNGKRIAAAHNFSDTLELYNFDNGTGVLSSLVSLSYFAGYGPYGVAFSPSGEILYVATESTGGVLYQYDLSSNIQDTIINSRTTLNVGASASPGITGALQLAPDNKIYVARWYKSTLGVIENPDSLGAACTYNPNGFYLGGRFSLG